MVTENLFQKLYFLILIERKTSIVHCFTHMYDFAKKKKKKQNKTKQNKNTKQKQKEILLKQE